ncbi:MAG: ABC transporter substrate-binding protein [Acidimicrobiia bacterium]|jgi:ABC-type branched-subunit amino acid transport system substrate-binding protein
MRKGRVLVVLVVSTIAASMVGVIAPAGAQSGSVPGVTAKQILVGGIAGVTNPTGRPYQDSFKGAQAYFDKINKDGGIYGRKYKVAANLDDQSRDSKNLLNARSLVEEKKVFAVVPMVTQTFASAQYLADKGVPTFGWNIQSDWSKGKSLFGEKGSWLCLGSQCITLAPNVIAQREGSKGVGLLAYGSSPQSADCSAGQENTFDRYGPKVKFTDRSLSFGFSANDISAAVQAVKDNGVDFIASCMDVNGEVNFAKALKQAGVNNVRFYAPEGYDPQVLEDLGADLEGFTFVTDYVPFEAAKDSKGMQEFLSAMKKIGVNPSEHALVGWQSAMLLNEGIKQAGKNFTQQSVVDAINKITAWTADGTRAKVDWTTAHGPTAPNSTGCAAYIQVKNGKFVPVYGQPGKPFVCFPENPYPATLDTPTYAAPGQG